MIANGGGFTVPVVLVLGVSTGAWLLVQPTDSEITAPIHHNGSFMTMMLPGHR